MPVSRHATRGWRAHGTALLEEAVATAARSGDEVLLARARLVHHDHGVVMTDAGWLEEQQQLAERLLEVAEPAGDDLAIGWAWYILGGLGVAAVSFRRGGARLAPGARTPPASGRPTDDARSVSAGTWACRSSARCPAIEALERAPRLRERDDRLGHGGVGAAGDDRMGAGLSRPRGRGPEHHARRTTGCSGSWAGARRPPSRRR